MEDFNNLWHEAQKDNLKDMINKLFTIMPKIPDELAHLKSEIDSLCEQFDDTHYKCGREFQKHQDSIKDLQETYDNLVKEWKIVSDSLEEITQKYSKLKTECELLKEQKMSILKRSNYFLIVSIILFIIVILDLNIEGKTLGTLLTFVGSLVGGAF